MQSILLTKKFNLECENHSKDFLLTFVFWPVFVGVWHWPSKIESYLCYDTLIVHSTSHLKLQYWLSFGAKGSYLGYRIDVLNWPSGVTLNPADFIGEIA